MYVNNNIILSTKLRTNTDISNKSMYSSSENLSPLLQNYIEIPQVPFLGNEFHPKSYFHSIKIGMGKIIVLLLKEQVKSEVSREYFC